ncbi:MAG: rod shape-determining protein RodA [Patescibacteria group bacterium]|jgi:rod shape determining protein RodA
MFSKLKSVDLLLFLFPIMLWIIGCVVLWSLTFASTDIGTHNLAIKQVEFGVIGIISMIILSLVDYRSLRSNVIIICVVTVALLIAVELVGKTSLGATRWLDLKFFQLQPSELAKMALIITLSAFLSPRLDNPNFKTLFAALFILIVPLGLVITQPDLGTAMILVAIFLGLIFMLKLRRAHYAVILISILLVLTASVLAFYRVAPFSNLLHDYQRNRVETFLNPESDPLGKGYNVRQAVIAIGNGGLWGKGLGQEVGHLSQLNFLPKAYTDFIFAATAESVGFVGAALVLFVYAGIFWRIIIAAVTAKDNFANLICFGFSLMLLFSVLVNVGMNLGIMPVTGIPLPFISAGGTALIVNFMLLGIIQSIIIRRKAIKFD